jgi:nicotinamide-nucleotide amidase
LEEHVNNQVWAEVVTVGSELVLGQLVDTNAAYIAQKLSEIGVGMAFHTTVGDDPDRMRDCFRTALDRCQIVIATGGIGPTEDDLTREVAAEVFGTELELHQDLLDHIAGLFARIGYKMAPNNKRQAYIPKGGRVIHNPRGTAPAFCCEKDDRIFFALPGVPFETEALVVEEVLPILKEKYSPRGRVWVNRVLKVCGVGESNVDAQIKEIIRSSKNPTIGLQAGQGEIKVRLTARAESAEEAERLLDEGESQIDEKLGEMIFGHGDETLPGNTADLIHRNNLTVAVGEALTRGRVASELGRQLAAGELKGGVIVNEPQNPGEFCNRLFKDFRPNVALAVNGTPMDDGKIQVDYLVRSDNGAERSRTLVIGGPERMVMERAAVIAIFTLYTFLRDTPEYGDRQ